MIMPLPQRVSGEAFAVERLRDDPNLDYSTLRQQAAEAGISMQPIHYGRARRQLGLPVLRDSRDTVTAIPPAAVVEQPEDRVTVDVDEVDEEVVDEEVVADAPAELAAPAVTNQTRRRGSAAFDFIVEELRREAAISYAQLRDNAAARGYTIAPIMYGRAKAMLGLVPVKPRGSGKAKKIAAAAEAGPLRLKQVESVAADRFGRQLDEVRNLEQLVAVVKEVDAERRRLRDVLERIVTMIDEALG
ncbi:MAG TPA: hypothetical protein VF384_11390 [Planctomycetota bacterium]